MAKTLLYTPNRLRWADSGTSRTLALFWTHTTEGTVESALKRGAWTADTQQEEGDLVGYLQVFLYLQLLDFMTTVVGLRMGGHEVSPFVHWLTTMGPTAGVALSKLVAFALGGICIWYRKERVICWVNYFFAALVVWNLAQIMKVLV